MQGLCPMTQVAMLLLLPTAAAAAVATAPPLMVVHADAVSQHDVSPYMVRVCPCTPCARHYAMACMGCATVSARLGAALGLQVGGGIEDVNHELVGGIYTQMARHIFCL